MEARLFRPLLGVASVAVCLCPTLAFGQMMWGPQPMIVQAPMAAPAAMPPAGHAPRGSEHVARSENFIVFASSSEWAQQVARVAEQNRRDLAIYWLGKELPPWADPCPIHVTSSPDLGAGGETRFSLLPRGAGNWMMSVQGTRERILDSVLPHEITHTLFATHFAPLNKYVPRWADEGACTTVEHESEKRKHRHYLTKFLQTGRGLAFNNMFRLKEYPADILPLYAQGHSAVQFLIDQSSAREFIAFIEQGMRSDDWAAALQDHYHYKSIGELQTQWNQWLLDGSPENLLSYSPRLQQQQPVGALASAERSSDPNPSATSLDGKVRFAIGNTRATPVHLASQTGATPGSYYKQRLRAIHEGQPTATGDAAVNPLPSTVASAAEPASVALEDRPIPAGASLPSTSAQGSAASASVHSTSRQQAPQTTGIQVLDMGTSPPVRGLRSSTAASSGMVPIRR